MSGFVARADLCALFEPLVYGGRLDVDTVIAPGAWRGTEWPCPGQKEMSGPGGRPFGLVECSCPCHAGGPAHELPARAGRTAVHPTEVLADG